MIVTVVAAPKAAGGVYTPDAETIPRGGVTAQRTAVLATFCERSLRCTEDHSHAKTDPAEVARKEEYDRARDASGLPVVTAAQLAPASDSREDVREIPSRRSRFCIADSQLALYNALIHEQDTFRSGVDRARVPRSRCHAIPPFRKTDRRQGQGVDE